jgi:hypothetical protein
MHNVPVLSKHPYCVLCGELCSARAYYAADIELCYLTPGVAILVPAQYPELLELFGPIGRQAPPVAQVSEHYRV